MNQNILKNLRYLADSAEGYRKNAFNAAINLIKNLDFEITSSKQLVGMPGIGKGIANRIDEILAKGKLKELEKVDEKNITLSLFENVWGIGTKTAEKLYDMGARKITDLNKEKYYVFLNDKQKRGLAYYQDFQKRAPYYLVDRIVNEIECAFEDLFYNIGTIYAAGSYRRHEKTSGDLDIIISAEENILSEFVEYLFECNILIEKFSLGKHKFMGVVELENGQYFRIDIIFSLPEELPFAILYFTGPKEYNIKVRGEAKKMGFSLNEFGLFDEKGKKIKKEFYSEKDILNFLDIDYKSPERRF